MRFPSFTPRGMAMRRTAAEKDNVSKSDIGEEKIELMSDENRLVIILKGRIDSNNAPAAEKVILDAIGANAGKDIAFDAEKLRYISSAGLRVLMKVRKMVGKTFTVAHVSRDVYDIFEATGFTELLDVKRAFRDISVDGCEMIGQGGYGKVYRIDPETIAKIYSPDISLAFIEREREISQKTFFLGMPTAIAYDVVRCSDRYGVVYERLDAKSAAEIIRRDRTRVSEIGQRMGALLKSIHETHAGEDAGLPDEKQLLLNRVSTLDRYMDAKDAGKIKDFVNAIPDRDTMLHGDFQANNIMINDDEIQLINTGGAAFGHPIFDIGQIMFLYLLFPQSNERSIGDKRRIIGFEPEDAKSLWDALCGTYFGLERPDEIKRMTDRLMPYAILMMCCRGFRHGVVSEEEMKARVNGMIIPRLLPMIEGARLPDQI